MSVIGRTSISFPYEYENEYLFLQKLQNRSEFICCAVVKYIADDNNLTDLEKYIKKQVFQEKWECTNKLLHLHTLLC